MKLDEMIVLVLLVGFIVELGIIGVMASKQGKIQDACNAHWRDQMEACDCLCLRQPVREFVPNITLNISLNSPGQT